MRKLNYISQLDGVRAIAVLLVIAYHCKVISFGWIGVNLFFVLSGFLISAILLNMSSKKNHSLSKKLKVFYIRRFLRIFPPYYFYLITLFIFASLITYVYAPDWLLQPYNSFNKSFIYLLTYTYNIYGALTGEAHKWQAHFWSLSVEEQFYIFWPVLVLITKRSRILLLFTLTIIIALLFRGTINFIMDSSLPLDRQLMFSYWLPTSQLDAFAIGGILAFAFLHNKLEKLNLTFFFILVLIMLSVTDIMFLLKSKQPLSLFLENLGFLTPVGTHYVTFTVLIPLLYHILLAIFIAFVIIRSNNWFVKHILNHKIAIFIGKISYGVYLYHYFILWALKVIWAKFQPSMLFSIRDKIILFIFTSLITIIVSYMSYRYIELPFLQRKKYFKL